MPVTAASIKAEFKEFENTDSAILDARIADADALLRGGTVEWGDKYDQAVKYKACHLVCLSPSGEFARLKPKEDPDGETTLYERHFQALLKTIPAPMVV